MAKAAKRKRKVSRAIAKPLQKAKCARKPKKTGKGSSFARAVRSSSIALLLHRNKRGAAVKFGKLDSEIEKALTGSKIFKKLVVSELALPDAESRHSAERAEERFQLVERDIRRAMVMSETKGL